MRSRFSRARKSSLISSLALVVLAGTVIYSSLDASAPHKPGPVRESKLVQGVPLSYSPEIVEGVEHLKFDEPPPGDPRGQRPLPAIQRFPDASPMDITTKPNPPTTREHDPERVNLVRTYDLKTGRVFEEEYVSIEEVLGSRYTEAGVGLYELLEDPEAVAKNFEPWTLCTDPTVGTYPRRVKVFMEFTTEAGMPYSALCSGTLIDPMHVLTAAHCVWAHEVRDDTVPIFAFADEIVVVPAYESGYEPFGSAAAVEMHVWPLWIDEHDYDHDIAVIDLDRPIGAITGWWGYGYNEECSFWEGGPWRHGGWPAENPYDGNHLYTNFGYFDECDPYGWDNRVYFEGPTWGGTSGAGAVRDLTGAVYGVFSQSDRSTVTYDCKITATKFGHIQQIITEDRPTALDLRVLDVKSTTILESGARGDTLEFTVVNYSRMISPGAHEYLIYLSDDAFISTADTYLGAGTFNYDFDTRDAVRVHATPPLIPADTSSGFYFIGVILNVSDWDMGNNASNGQEAASVVVMCPPSDPPTYVGPWEDGTCLPVNLIFDWNAVAGLADYQLQVGTSCGTGTTIDLTTTQYTWYGFEYNTTYSWRVRSKAQCGDWGTWGPCWSFTTRPNLAETVTPLAPAEGDHCVPTAATVSWEPYPNALGYEFRIDAQCGEGTAQAAAGNSIAVTLDSGTVYSWSVRSQTDCNGWWTDWSSCYTFKTAPDWAARPQMTTPENGSACASPDVFLVWEIDPEASSYDVQVGTSCGEGTITTVDQNLLGQYGLLNDVTYWWRVRTNHECGPVSVWSPCWSFTVDAEPPAPPPVVVADRPVEVWSNDNTIFVDWDPATDDCSLPLYSHLFDEEPGTVPDDEADSEATNTTGPALADAQDHWFHIKSVDSAGNSSSPVHLGPFWIDATAPDAPVIDFTTIDVGVPTGPTLLTIDWQPVTDAMSGTAGYSWWADRGPAPPDQPDLVVDTTECTVSLEFEKDFDFWFYLRAVDVAGNGSDVVTLGPFPCDTEMFGCGIIAPSRDEVLSEGEIYPVQWFYFEDAPAVLAGGRLEYSLDGGDTYVFITGLLPADIQAGSYDWTVPIAASGEALLKLSIIDTIAREVHGRSERFVLRQISGVPDAASGGGRIFVLRGNRPNPFNPATTIEFELKQAAAVRLSVFDVSGHLVRTLVDGRFMESGLCRESWDGRGASGRLVASGTYFYQIEAGGQVETARMTLVK